MPAETKERRPIEYGYLSPRWSGEILDCAIPMTFDQYDHCAANCMYCFSYFQKSLKEHNPLFVNQTKGYQAMPVRAVHPDHIRKLFSLQGEYASAPKNQFADFIRQRMLLQWGGLSDPFDNYEKQYGVGLEIMKIFKELDYPLRYSTKGTWWIDDPRYVDLCRGQKNWNLMVSIINLDDKLSRLIDRGVSVPMERFNTLEKWVALEAGDAILRLRPFIIGMTDKDDEYLQMIEIAAAIGCKGVSTEFFCLENRGDKTTHVRYNKMSEAIGMDIVEFYRDNSPGQTGYLRLNAEIKRPYVTKMRDLCHKLGMRFSTSDAHNKDFGDTGSCCALGDNAKTNKGQFTEVLVKARKMFERGEEPKVYFSRDMLPHLIKAGFDKFLWRRAEGFNTEGSESRTKRYNQTMLEYIREIWNTPNSGKSPYKYFQGLLKPTGLDGNQDVIYEYHPYTDNTETA
jgi:DNA repair photolyase